MSENQDTTTNADNTPNEENKKSFTERLGDAADKTREWLDNHPVARGCVCGLVLGTFAAIGFGVGLIVRK